MKKNLANKINLKDVKIELIENEYFRKTINIYYRVNKEFKEIGYFYVNIKDAVLEEINWGFSEIIEKSFSNGMEVCFLEIFFIEKEFRSRGIGSYALKQLETLLKEKLSIDIIYVSPFPFEDKKRDEKFMIGYEKVLKFYKKNGYNFEFCSEDWSLVFPLIALYSKNLDDYFE